MTFLLTALSLLAFSANGLLCRLALREGLIDAAGFTAVRLAAGALILFILVRGAGPRRAPVKPNGFAVLALFAYAILFSYAYLSLDAGAGALIAFAAVQITMMAGGLLRGERPGPRLWLGFAVAASGLVSLLLPGLSAPPLGPAAVMFGAGIAWGVYSLLARGEADPLGRSASNFLLAAPLALTVAVGRWDALHLSRRGIGLAMLSGSLTSGLGYVVWYAALRRLSAVRGALVQLLVPALTAAAGVVFLGEPATRRLVVSGLVILGGVAVATGERK